MVLRIVLFTAKQPFDLPSESETGFTVNLNHDSVIECCRVVVADGGNDVICCSE